MRNLIVAALLLATQSVCLAGDQAYIPVGSAKTRKTIIAFPRIVASDEKSQALARVVHETVVNDLTFMDLFKFLGEAAFPDNAGQGIAPGTFKLGDWSGAGADVLVKTALVTDGTGVTLEGHLYDVRTGKELLARRLIASVSDAKTLGHTFANHLVTALTGMPGIFLTKIAMSCDTGGSKKEIYVMDFDGTDVKQITQHGSISFAPAWSPDGTRIVYSRFAKHKNNVKNIDLYEFDFKTDTIRMLSNRHGINSGAAYSPDGKKIALTMSFLGTPAVFTLDSGANTVTRITKSLGEETDPTWSPDGKRIAFVSTRTGKAMIFSASADGSDPKRLTFAGSYNATPSWSPQNNKIAFAGWIDKTFDVFIMNPDGTNIERLTKDQGNNEDTTFSPDGNFVAFSSNRTGQKNIYVMNVDGTFVKRLTYGLGNCVAPKWSNPPK